MRSIGSGFFSKMYQCFSKMYKSISRISKNLFQHFVMLKYIHGKKRISTEDFKTLFSCVFKFFENWRKWMSWKPFICKLCKVPHTFSQRIPYYVQLYRWIDRFRISCMDFRYVALLTLNKWLVLGKSLYSRKAIRKGDSISKMVSFGYQHFEHQTF